MHKNANIIENVAPSSSFLLCEGKDPQTIKTHLTWWHHRDHLVVKVYYQSYEIISLSLWVSTVQLLLNTTVRRWKWSPERLITAAANCCLLTRAAAVLKMTDADSWTIIFFMSQQSSEPIIQPHHIVVYRQHWTADCIECVSSLLAALLFSLHPDDFSVIWWRLETSCVSTVETSALIWTCEDVSERDSYWSFNVATFRDQISPSALSRSLLL